MRTALKTALMDSVWPTTTTAAALGCFFTIVCSMAFRSALSLRRAAATAKATTTTADTAMAMSVCNSKAVVDSWKARRGTSKPPIKFPPGASNAWFMVLVS